MLINRDNNDILPHNIAIEQAILGAILNNNSAYDKISNIINSEDFFDKSHQILYKGIVTRLENGHIADILTLMNFIVDSGIEPDYIVQLSEHVYPSENIAQYANILIELSTRRKLINIAQEIKDNAYTEKMSITEQVNLVEKSVFNLTEKSTKNKTVSFAHASSTVLKNTYNIINSDKKVIGVPTGFLDLDDLLGGMRDGELIILAARPSVGKSAIASNIAVNCTLDKKSGGPILFISLEMPYEQIAMRIISSLAKVPLSLLMHAKISKSALKECMGAINKFKDLPLYIHDASFMNVNTIRSLIRHMKRQNNIKMVIVDYLQLIDASGRQESREQEISKISRSLKLIAKEVGVPIIALSQMSRDMEKRRDGNAPKLSDLRGSGSIEQDADTIIFLYRQNDNDRTMVRVSVAKNRNGALGEFNLYFDGEFTTFKNFGQ